MYQQEIEQLILAPKSRKCFGKDIRFTQGDISAPEHILDETQSTTRLCFKKGGQCPKLIIDLGPESTGGYPVFKVKDYEGNAVLRISYADHYAYMFNNQNGEKGDFIRGDCKYLGVELPVLPANPNRFELYSIQRSGEFMFPLIQGQQRFVMLSLDTEESSLELEYFYVYYTSDLTKNDGFFKSSSALLDRIWYASSYTVQLASISNSDAWEIVNGKLLVRSLTKGNPAGIYKDGIGLTNYTFSFKAEISVNPHCFSGIGWLVRAKNQDNGYLFRLDLDNTIRVYIRTNGKNREIGRSILQSPVSDNIEIKVETKVAGDTFEVFVDSCSVLQLKDKTFASGTVGFCQTVEKWAIVHSLSIESDGETLFSDNFDGTLDSYIFTKSPIFLADGAKRDRLPWSGDLYWAGRNAYYAFHNYKYMPQTLRMLAKNQTPEGYIWATCYPEDTDSRRIGEYGYYESDIFAAWFTIVLSDYYLFTGDLAEVKRHYQAVLDVQEYLWEYVDARGVFYQRYQTSKGLWDHALNDYGNYAYNNMIMLFSFREAEKLAKAADDIKYQEIFHKRAESIEKGIFNLFWNEKTGYFTKSDKNSDLCIMANSLAMELQLVNMADAGKIVKNVESWLQNNGTMGKILSLYISGCFRYGFSDIAYKRLLGQNGNESKKNAMGVSWSGCITDEDGSVTTTECAHHPVNMLVKGHAWGDRSHPDTGVAHIISANILGVEPLSPGFQKFTLNPHFCGLKEAYGIVPTPYGNITVYWNTENLIPTVKVKHPKEIELVFGDCMKDIVITEEIDDTDSIKAKFNLVNEYKNPAEKISV